MGYEGPIGVGIPGAFAPRGTATPAASGGATSGGRTQGGATNPGGASSPSSPAPQGSGGGVAGSGNGTPAPRPTGGSTKKPSSFEGDLSWDLWWSLNREKYLNLKSVLRARGQLKTSHQDLDLGATDGLDAAEAEGRAERLRAHIVPFLRHGLEDTDPRVRAESVTALGKIGRPASLADLMPLLKDSQRTVRHAAILALGLSDDTAAIPVLAAIVQDAAGGRRALGQTKSIGGEESIIATVALGLAGSHGGPGSRAGVPTLIELMKSRKRQVDIRVAAALALGLAQAREAVPALKDVLADDDADDYVRANAANALGKIGDRTALGPLVKALRDGHAQVRRSATMALGHVADRGDTAVVRALQKAARSGADRAQRNFAIISLGEIGGVDARNFLLGLVRKGRSFETSFGALALGIYGWKNEDPAEKEIAAVIHDQLLRVTSCRKRGAYILALGLLGHEEAAPDLIGFVNRHGHADLRVHAALALGLLRSREAVGALRSALHDKGSLELRTAASIGLGLIGDPRATDVLMEVIGRDTGAAIRGASIRGIGLIGDMRVALGLGHMLTDEELGLNDATRAFAAGALGLLGDKSEIPTLSRISSDVNYTAQRGVVVGLLGRY